MARPSRPFRKCDTKQSFILPLNTADWLPEGHLALFIDKVVDEFDLTAFYERYDNDGRGCVPYDPKMMVRIYLYGYASGVTSSRKLEKRMIEDIAFRYLAGGNTPDHHTLSEFRRTNLKALMSLFYQILEMVKKAELADLGQVAIDGTKVKANAAMDRTWSLDKLNKEEQKLLDDLKRYFDELEKNDAAEDALYGEESGFLLPKGMRTKKEMLERIRQAKKEIEEERQRQINDHQRLDEEAAEARKKKEEEAAQQGKKLRGRPRKPLDEKQMRLKPARLNLTDMESKLMSGKSGFLQGWNVQLAVTHYSQIIGAVAVTDHGNDRQMLNFMLDRLEASGIPPDITTVDNGFASLREIEMACARTDLYIALCEDPRDLPPGWGEGEMPLCLSTMGRMSWKMASAEGRSIYGLRGSSVEPVNGQLKEQQGMRQFRLRGQFKVEAEAHLHAAGNNLKKICQWPAQAIDKCLGKRGRTEENEENRGGSALFHRKLEPLHGISGAF